MEIITGKIEGPQKVVVYGPEGIGKSTFASKFPNALFIDTEESTKHMDVARFPKPTSWTMLMEQVRHVKANPHVCSTLIIDTADWAEQLCAADICAKNDVKSLGSIAYGNGHIYLADEFGRLLNLLSDVIEKNINVVITAHAAMRKFEQPHEMGAYDRWELKLHKKISALVKEWADMVLFANYEVLVVNVDNQGAQKGKNKAQGGQRVIYTEHNPCWDAKNRHGLANKLDFSYDAISHCITTLPSKAEPAIETSVQTSVPIITEETQAPTNVTEDKPMEIEPPQSFTSDTPKHLKPLFDLMALHNVTVEEIQKAVSNKGYYTRDTSLENYDENFVTGVLIGAWAQVFEEIKTDRIPF